LIEEGGPGLIHLYYGQGVRKSSGVIGMAVRAAGNNLQVDFVQFMKSGDSGEVTILKEILNIRYWCPGHHPFIMSQGPETVHFEHAEKALKYALAAIEKGTDLLVCDEMLDTIIFEILQKEQVLDLMKRCRKKTELVMTGRYASKEFIESADYVTEFVQLKHPYYRGARARKGFEY